MAVDLATQVSNLAALSVEQLRAISEDFHHPDEVQEAARDLIVKFDAAQLRQAVSSFAAATPVFADLTKGLVDITTLARKFPGGDAVATLTPIVRQLGVIFGTVVDAPHELLPAAGESDAQEAPALDVVTPAPAPAKGSVSTSRKLSEIAGEYVGMFQDATIDPSKVPLVDRLATVLVSFRTTYEKLGADLRIPWHFIGLIHCMESNFNFGTHLHNGDSLMHRTSHVPKGRPTAEIADPPFAWTTSARDALTMMGFQTQTNWSLAAQLFRLERNNGMGYRIRGTASPYLWSFSDRYTGGKFTSDGVYDPAATSEQCGAAALLKRLVARGDVTV
jgi:lysozyme family protein